MYVVLGATVVRGVSALCGVASPLADIVPPLSFDPL